jgi:hypothetical protein
MSDDETEPDNTSNKANTATITLKKLGYENLDKIVSVDYLKTTVFKSFTKKDFCLFVSENDSCKQYMKALEQKVLASHIEVKGMLTQYLSTISTEITKFKNQVKEIKRKAKLEEDKLKEQMIFEKKLQEMVNGGKKDELEKKLGISLDKYVDKSAPNTPEATPMEVDKPKAKFVVNVVKKPITSNIPEKLIDTGSLDLNTFFAFLQQVIKNDLLIIKDMEGNKLAIHDLDLDNDKIRMKLRPE